MPGLGVCWQHRLEEQLGPTPLGLGVASDGGLSRPLGHGTARRRCVADPSRAGGADDRFGIRSGGRHLLLAAHLAGGGAPRHLQPPGCPGVGCVLPGPRVRGVCVHASRCHFHLVRHCSSIPQDSVKGAARHVALLGDFLLHPVAHRCLVNLCHSHHAGGMEWPALVLAWQHSGDLGRSVSKPAPVNARPRAAISRGAWRHRGSGGHSELSG
mmetsp:Transcript_43270/g.124928  ORF Transcript_43270/g.124928 Transcript_43270/m.124928 type:complete len:212 (+) Transcript_43270:238-873(+)